ncbi:WxcM-like domain-containing protein [Pedobacter sp. UYP1]|uniref:WxcM-like domain-containing protein n=1 Tax=Pedobacter sp. UYP1 TaxID=1756396 RepID=UPI00339B7567
MSFEVNLICGGQHTDHRGTLYFVNDFDMSEVKRMYMISHSDTTVRRGWRGHKLEQRWFCVVQGSFELKLVKIDDWDKPDQNLAIETVILSADNPQVIHIPVGYATGFRALVPDSKVMVYADRAIADAKLDDHLYPADYFRWE